MYIKRLVIYGYGQLNDLTITLGSSFHVLYGVNEAGKSTILSFIETMLFGFPKRQQNEPGYEPKSGGIHGGKIELDLGADGTLVIERKSGRKPQESIIVHNGNMIRDEQLKRLLHGINRTVFQDLFSTRLEHLRALEKLNEEDLNRFLLGAGISGGLPLYELEESLEKKQAALFKPQGRKPVINQVLQELKTLNALVEKNSTIKEHYQQLVLEKQETEQQLETLAREEESLNAELRCYEKAMAFKPLYDEKQSLELKRKELLQVVRFPEDGIVRFNNLKARLLELEGEKKSMKQIDAELPIVNDKLLNYLPAVKRKREMAERYRANQERMLVLKEQLKNDEEWMADLLDRLGSGWSEETLQAVNIGYREQETAERLVNEIKQRSSQMAYMEEELTLLRQKLTEVEKEARKGDSKRNSTVSFFILFAGVFGSVFFFFSGREALAFLLFMMMAAVSFLFRLNQKQKGEKLYLAQLKSQYDDLVQRCEEAEKMLDEKSSELNKLSHQYGFHGPINGDVLLHCFEQIREAKKRLRSIMETRNEIRQFDAWQTNYVREVRDLAEAFELDYQEDALQLLIKMEAILEEEEKKKQMFERLVEQKKAETRQIESIETKMKLYEQALEELLQMADCHNEEAFRQKGKAWAEREKISERLKLIEHQIIVQFPDEREQKEIVRLLEQGKDINNEFISRLDQKRTEIDQEKKKRLKRLAEIHVELKKMEESGDLETSIQRLEIKKSAFRDHVKAWAVNTIALDALKKTKENYRKERLPNVISLAETYFAEITGGAYRFIQVPINGNAFFVESEEGMRYLPKELSRGTQEQLYLSLRLALATVYPVAIRYPILLDDILVHFDRRRRKAAIDVIKEVGTSRQVLFFTCHDHIAAEFDRQALILLSQTAK